MHSIFLWPPQFLLFFVLINTLRHWDELVRICGASSIERFSFWPWIQFPQKDAAAGSVGAIEWAVRSAHECHPHHIHPPTEKTHSRPWARVIQINALDSSSSNLHSNFQRYIYNVSSCSNPTCYLIVRGHWKEKFQLSKKAQMSNAH